MRQLHERRFARVYWLRTPDPDELQVYSGRGDITSKQRVMTIWYTTVLDAVSRVRAETRRPGALVMDDTILLRPDVSYETVVAEVHQRNAPAGVSGYCDQWQKQNLQGELVGGWFGVKGVWMTPAWCEEMSCILQNTNFQHFQHVDMWLIGLLKQQSPRASTL